MNKKFLTILVLLLSIFLFRNVYALEDEYYEENNSEEVSEVENVSNKKEIDAGSYKIVIDDMADLLTEEEEEKLIDDMRPMTEYGNAIFVSVNVNNYSADSFARSYYHDNYGTNNGSLFLVDMDNREIYIFSDGYNYNVITNSKAYIITDNIYRYASNEEYYDCASVAFSQMSTLLSGGKILEPMRHISNGFVAIVVSFFTTFLIVLGSSGIKKAKYNEIINNSEVSFSATNVTGVKTGTHRVYSPVSESSGGGSSGGGGGGGGGGSSGGGGGHSF